MMITINGKEYAYDQVKTIDLLFKKLKIDASGGIALAVNNTVIPRSEWQRFQLKAKDSVLLIKATQGG